MVPGANDQREAWLEVGYKDHVPAGGGPGPQQDSRGYRLHYPRQAAPALQAGGSRPAPRMQDHSQRGEAFSPYIINDPILHFKNIVFLYSSYTLSNLSYNIGVKYSKKEINPYSKYHTINQL
jgi:hypothetical protein